jgi:hypothetical protein
MCLMFRFRKTTHYKCSHGFYLCLSNFVIFYKMVTSWLYMYEGIDKVMNIHTQVLDGSVNVL